MSKLYKTRKMLLDENEQLENEIESLKHKIQSLKHDKDYFADNWYQLLQQKTKLIKYLKEHGATFTLNKIKELEK